MNIFLSFQHQWPLRPLHRAQSIGVSRIPTPRGKLNINNSIRLSAIPVSIAFQPLEIKGRGVTAPLLPGFGKCMPTSRLFCEASIWGLANGAWRTIIGAFCWEKPLRCGAEGATAPETLRQKDQQKPKGNLESCGTVRDRTPKG